MPTYTLITVTHGGEVRHARGFETLRMCQEARSIALTGMTIAQNEVAGLAERERQIALDRHRQLTIDAEWRKKHPPRPPTDVEREGLRVMQLSWEHERSRLASQCLLDGTGGHALVYRRASTFGDDGLMRDWFEILGRSYSAVGHWMPAPEPDRGGIRYAHCVIELPDEPAVALSKHTASEAV